VGEGSGVGDGEIISVAASLMVGVGDCGVGAFSAIVVGIVVRDTVAELVQARARRINDNIAKSLTRSLAFIGSDSWP
jgi:hypothetical protein